MEAILKDKIFIIDNFIAQNECDEIIKRIDSQNKKIVYNQFDFTIDSYFYYWDTIGENLRDEYFNVVKNKYHVNDIQKCVTLTKIDSKHASHKHVDEVFDNEKFKMFIYLNETSGGTNFYNNENKIEIESKTGRCVIFDISLPHESQKLKQNEIKYLVGFRLITNEIIEQEKIMWKNVFQKLHVQQSRFLEIERVCEIQNCGVVGIPEIERGREKCSVAISVSCGVEMCVNFILAWFPGRAA